MNEFKNIIKNLLDNYFLYYIDKVRGCPNLDNGFIEVKPTNTDYIHEEGRMSLLGERKRVLLPDGQWQKYRPEGELQKRNGRDKIACVTFSSLNVIEELIRFMMDSNDEEHIEIVKILKHFGIIKDGKVNCSDRAIAKLSGTTRRGNSFKRVAQTIHKYLLIPEEDYAWVDNWNDYYKPVLKNLIEQGEELGKYIEINYEWVYPKEFNEIKRYGPHTTSVFAGGRWNTSDIIPRTNQRHNHATGSDGFEMNKYDDIFDSYNPFGKRVAWNYGLGMGMQFTISLKKKLPNLRQKLLNDGYEWVIRAEQEKGAKGEAYDIETDKLIYLPPADLIQNTVKEKSIQGKIKFITEEEFKQLNN